MFHGKNVSQAHLKASEERAVAHELEVVRIAPVARLFYFTYARGRSAERTLVAGYAAAPVRAYVLRCGGSRVGRSLSGSPK
jgi:hypothetical protein